MLVRNTIRLFSKIGSLVTYSLRSDIPLPIRGRVHHKDIKFKPASSLLMIPALLPQLVDVYPKPISKSK